MPTREAIRKSDFFEALRRELGPDRREFWPGAPGTNGHALISRATLGETIGLSELDAYVRSENFDLLTTSDIAKVDKLFNKTPHKRGLNLRTLPASVRNTLDIGIPTSVSHTPDIDNPENVIHSKGNSVLRVVGSKNTSGRITKHQLLLYAQYVQEMCDVLKGKVFSATRVREIPLVARKFAIQVSRFEQKNKSTLSSKRGWLSRNGIEQYNAFVQNRLAQALTLVTEKGIGIDALPKDLQRFALRIDQGELPSNIFDHTRSDKHLSPKEQRLLIANSKRWATKSHFRTPLSQQTETLLLAMQQLDHLAQSKRHYSSATLRKKLRRYKELETMLKDHDIDLKSLVESAREIGPLAAVHQLSNRALVVENLKANLTQTQMDLVRGAAKLDGDIKHLTREELQVYLRLLSARGMAPLSHQELAALRHQLTTFPTTIDPNTSTAAIRDALHATRNPTNATTPNGDVLAHVHTGSLDSILPKRHPETDYDLDRPLYDTIEIPGPFFTVCHLSNRLYAPLQVSHVLSADDLVYSDLMNLGSNRHEHFHADTRAPNATAAPNDIFSGGGEQEDRGHVFSYLDGATVMAGFWSFTFSNMFAQPGQLNRFSWKDLEVGVRNLIKTTGGTAVVHTGALFLNRNASGQLEPMESEDIETLRTERMTQWKSYALNKEKNRVREIQKQLAVVTSVPERDKLLRKSAFWSDEIPGNFDAARFEEKFQNYWTHRLPRPTHAYKTFVLRLPNGALTTFAILLKNDTAVPTKTSDSNYESYVLEGITTIDAIERYTGMDMFAFLPGDDTTGVESRIEAGSIGTLDRGAELFGNARALTILPNGPIPNTDASPWYRDSDTNDALDYLATMLNSGNAASAVV